MLRYYGRSKLVVVRLLLALRVRENECSTWTPTQAIFGVSVEFIHNQWLAHSPLTYRHCIGYVRLPYTLFVNAIGSLLILVKRCFDA
jgi:hypothetical protein